MRFIACALLVITTTYASKVCEPGTSKREGSNVCFCLGDGSGWTCTPDSSAETLPSNSLIRETRGVKEIQDRCEPGKSFKNFCNSCQCGKDGLRYHAVCTMIACDPEIWNIDGSLKHPDETLTNLLLRTTRQVKENEDTCEPGKRFNYYCNSCFCGNDGKVAHSMCTRMACDPEIWNKDGSLKRPNGIATNPLLRKERDVEERCEPGESFMDYCNFCSCADDGLVRHSVCTEMACDYSKWNKDGSPKITSDNLPLMRTRRSDEFLCQPGKVYQDGCNTCFCSRDGKSSACTLMMCPLRKGAVPAPRVCEPGKNFKIDCNHCVCSEDGSKVACTTMACSLPNDARNKRSEPVANDNTFCKPNTTFKKDCNTCRCNRDGSAAACTLMECHYNAQHAI